MPLLPSVRVKYDVGLTTVSVLVQARTLGPQSTSMVHQPSISIRLLGTCSILAISQEPRSMSKARLGEHLIMWNPGILCED